MLVIHSCAQQYFHQWASSTHRFRSHGHQKVWQEALACRRCSCGRQHEQVRHNVLPTDLGHLLPASTNQQPDILILQQLPMRKIEIRPFAETTSLHVKPPKLARFLTLLTLKKCVNFHRNRFDNAHEMYRLRLFINFFLAIAYPPWTERCINTHNGLNDAVWRRDDCWHAETLRV